MSEWDRLLELVKDEPHKFVLFFEGDDKVELEYFPDDYIGELEAGCGLWRITGALPDVVGALIKLGFPRVRGKGDE